MEHKGPSSNNSQIIKSKVKFINIGRDPLDVHPNKVLSESDCRLWRGSRKCEYQFTYLVVNRHVCIK